MQTGNARRERQFLARPTSVPEARQFVVDELVDTKIDVGDVALLTSEVATNAVRHAHTDFRLRIESRPNGVRIEVINDAPELLLIKKDPSLDGGQGLRLLDRIAQCWGVESRSDEKVVWFELAPAGVA